MVDLEILSVSLTKNGYLKIATLIKEYPSNKILDNVYGSHDGVNLARSQVANILCADPISDVVPAFWDELRTCDERTIRAFTFLAIVFSHHRLIQIFLAAGQGSPQGHIERDDMSQKEFTNLAAAMAAIGLCEYERGDSAIDYDLAPLQAALSPAKHLIEPLFRAKLIRCGWRDPDEFLISEDQPLLHECHQRRFHEVLGMSAQAFAAWITGRRPRSRR